MLSTFFFFNDTATTEIYTLSLHDALPIWIGLRVMPAWPEPSIVGATITCSRSRQPAAMKRETVCAPPSIRSEEHTSELQSRSDLVCRLLLEKKKQITARQLPLERWGRQRR